MQSVLRQPLLDDADDNGVGDQGTGVHEPLGLDPHRGQLFNGSPQYITGGYLRDAEPVYE